MPGPILIGLRQREQPAHTDYGEVSSNGKIGDSSLSTDFGNIELSGAEGNLEASSKSGDITIENVNGADNQIDLSSDFGDIELSQSTASTVVIHSSDEADAPVECEMTHAQLDAFAREAQVVVAAGRPECPRCGLAMDADGHNCPRSNGDLRGHRP